MKASNRDNEVRVEEYSLRSYEQREAERILMLNLARCGKMMFA